MSQLKMLQKTSFVCVLLSACRTHTVHPLHMLDQFVRHFEYLLTVLAWQKLTRRFMLSNVDFKVERFGECDHALLAL